MTSSLASHFSTSTGARRAAASFGFAAIAATLVVGGATATTGCSLLGCTEVGCDNQVRAVIGGAAVDEKLSVTVSAEGKTAHAEVDVAAKTCTSIDENVRFCGVFDGAVEIGLQLPPEFEGESTVVTVTAMDATGTTVLDATRTATITETEPNGSSCGPTCYNAEEHFDL